MATKSQIVAELGQSDLLMPERLARSLVANDQIKYYFALLQMARSNADRPIAPPRDLKSERIASQIGDTWLDAVVAGARRSKAGSYTVPNAADIIDRIRAAITTMIVACPMQRETASRRGSPRSRCRAVRMTRSRAATSTA